LSDAACLPIQAAQQLDGADPASQALRLARYWPWLAGRLISTPLGGAMIGPADLAEHSGQ